MVAVTVARWEHGFSDYVSDSAVLKLPLLYDFSTAPAAVTSARVRREMSQITASTVK